MRRTVIRSTRLRIAGLVLLAVATLVAADVAASPAARGAAPRAKLQRAVDALAAAGPPGAVALVRDDDRTIRVAGGYRNLARRTPMRASDRFRVGSSTKSFVAVAVLQLAGEGKVALDDSVEHWLPGLVPNGGQITVRHLLNHTSGLSDYAPEGDETFIRRVLANRRRAWQPRELVAIATAQRPLFAPGARWSYSNTGWILLGLIVEAASGNTLAAELGERIFAPLRLRATSFDTKPRISGRHAHGYSRVGARRRFDISVLNQSWAWAAGAIVSTADDLARFYRALLAGRLLRRGLLGEMKTTVPTPSPVQRYGLGLIRTRLPCGVFWGHGGETLGYQSFADSRADGKRQVMIALNADQSLLGPRAQRLLERLRAIAYCG